LRELVLVVDPVGKRVYGIRTGLLAESWEELVILDCEMNHQWNKSAERQLLGCQIGEDGRSLA
jgi:hypothetical protein